MSWQSEVPVFAVPEYPAPPQRDPTVMANPPRTGARTVVAIDFGTTYTGLAYALVKGSQQPSFEDVRLFTDWILSQEPKIPSEISFSPTLNGQTQWGRDIESGSQVVRYAKLNLQARGRRVELEKLADVVNGLQIMARFRADQTAGAKNSVPKHLTLSPEDVVTELLDRVVRRWYDMVQSENRAALATNPLDLIITHPGEWTYEARNKTVRSVLAAFPLGRFPKRRFVSLCSEPEASAFYTSMSASRNMRGRLQPGDCFVICDAGGGTVDLLTYEMVSRQPFQIVPLTKAKSAHCGANSIDSRFFAFLKRILRDLDLKTAGAGGHDVLDDVAETLLGLFTAIKHTFDDQDSADIELPSECQNKVLPDAWAMAKVIGGPLHLTREDLEEIFNPVVDEITTHLARQVAQAELGGRGGRKRVTHIFMAGGFSENPYLFRRVKEWARLTQMEVERGDDTWGAVARGAVLKATGVGASLPSVVKESPRHYGIICNQTYHGHTENDDAEIDVDSLSGRTMAKGQVLWMVQKGDIIPPGEPVVQERIFWLDFKGRDEAYSKQAAFRFVASKADNLPTQESELEPDVESIQLRFKYSDIPKEARDTRKRANSRFFTYEHATLKATITVADRVHIAITAERDPRKVTNGGSVAGNLEQGRVVMLAETDTSL